MTVSFNRVDVPVGRAGRFATAYSDPVPSPDGDLLGWISDRTAARSVVRGRAAARTGQPVGRA